MYHLRASRAVNHSQSTGPVMRLTVAIVVLSLLLPSSALARSGDGVMGDGPIARAAGREAARLAQSEPSPNGSNPFIKPGVILIVAGAVVAIMGSTMPQLRTQTSDYDLCAAANGGPTGPSTRNPACDDFRTANKGFLWAGGAAIATGATLLTVGAVRGLDIHALPGGGAFIGKTTSF
jgi:hypothetical protein